MWKGQPTGPDAKIYRAPLRATDAWSRLYSELGDERGINWDGVEGRRVRAQTIGIPYSAGGFEGMSYAAVCAYATLQIALEASEPSTNLPRHHHPLLYIEGVALSAHRVCPVRLCESALVLHISAPSAPHAQSLTHIPYPALHLQYRMRLPRTHIMPCVTRSRVCCAPSGCTTALGAGEH